MLNISNIKENFPQTFISNKIYLDSAATSLKPLVVGETLQNYYCNQLGSLERTFSLDYGIIEDSIETIKSFFNINNDYELIFTSGTTESINLVSKCFVQNLDSKRFEIHTSYFEHHSNLLPWLTIESNKSIELKKFDHSDLSFINSLDTTQCEFATYTHMSNVTGQKFNIKPVIEFYNQESIPILIDVAQSAAHDKLNISKLGADFYAFSAHKVFGPHGLGLLVMKKKYLEILTPYRYGGGMVKNVTDLSWKHGHKKFEAGTQNPPSIIAWANALKLISNIGWDNITKHNRNLSAELKSGLMKLSNFKIYTPISEDSTIVSFEHISIHSHDIAELLLENNIILRVGHHCAQPLLNKLKSKSIIRVSFNFYNTLNDINYLLKILSTIK